MGAAQFADASQPQQLKASGVRLKVEGLSGPLGPPCDWLVGRRRFKMIQLGLSKLWEFSQSSWLQLFFSFRATARRVEGIRF